MACRAELPLTTKVVAPARPAPTVLARRVPAVTRETPVWCRNRGWKHVASRSVSGKRNAAHHLLREELGGPAEIGVPVSCALDRHRSVWLRPPELPHPDGVLDGSLRRLVFAACCETPHPDGVRSFPVLRGRRRGPRSSAVPGGHPTSVGGSSHRARLRLDLEQASSGVRRRDGPGSGSSSNRNRSINPLIGSSSELLGLTPRRRSVEGQPPVVLCQSRAHPSGRTFERRSSHRLLREAAGAHDRRTPGGSPHGERRSFGPSRARCHRAPADRGRDEGQRHRFRRTAARRLER